MKIIFMGTSDFAVPVLQGIIASRHDIVAVFTKEPKKSGRGHKVQKSPVQLEAEKTKAQIFTPKTLKDPKIEEAIISLAPDVIVVAAYGHIIPKKILDIPQYGCINIHPSLLPRWRGAAPIERTILAGDKETAVCIMQMDEGLDTGDILSTQRVLLQDRMTAGELSAHSAKLGSKMLLEILENIPSIVPFKQPTEGVSYAHKITKEEAEINWQDSAAHIDRMVRAFNPWPSCFFTYNGEQIKIIESSFNDTQACGVPGEVIDKNFTICCGHGTLNPLKLQRPGKKIISVKDFLNGMNIKPGITLK